MPDDNAQQPVTRADLERFAEAIIGNISASSQSNQ
jgi:hypothetical protein